MYNPPACTTPTPTPTRTPTPTPTPHAHTHTLTHTHTHTHTHSPCCPAAPLCPQGGHNILYEDTSKARSGDYQPLGKEAASFLAGILDHMPGLLTFTAPSASSYKRISPSTWSGCYRCGEGWLCEVLVS